MLISMQGSDVGGGDSGTGTFSGENGGVIKAYNNHIEGASKYVTYSENNVEFDAYEVNSASETVPASVKAKQGGTSYNNFDTNTSLMYAYTADSPEQAKANVIQYAGRMNGGDFKWVFNNSVDDESYSVNQPLKDALVNYTTNLKAVGGIDGVTTPSNPNELTGIALNTTSKALVRGGKVQLTVSPIPSKAALSGTTTWTSDNAGVATVSASGLVTAVSDGTARITAENSGFTASCTITVSAPVNINGVVLSSDSLILTAGSTEKLTAVAAPSNATEEYTVVWETSNPSAATVSGGTITAVAEGTAVITAKITGAGGTFSANCNVTVEKAPPAPVLPAEDMVHNFTTDGMTSEFYTIAGSNKAVTASYNGVSLTKSLKMDSNGTVTFNAPAAGTLTLVFTTGNSGNKININSKVITILSSGIVEEKITASGSVRISKNSGESHLCYIAFVPEGGGSGDNSEVVAITGITIDKTTASLKVGESVNLSATVTPNNTTYSKSVNWKSSNPQVATVSGGRVTAAGEGTAVITATSVGNNAFSAECTVTVTGSGGNQGGSEGGSEGGNPGGSTGGEPGSVEQVHSFVDRLYSLALGRQPDEKGKSDWSNALIENRSSGVDIAYGFVFSDECKGNNLSNTDFVEMLYNVFMDRASDEGGRNAWVSQLDAGVEREKILEGFLFSQEFSEICARYGISMGTLDDQPSLRDAIGHYRNRNAGLTKFVARCYTQALGRTYEDEGLEAWCRAILTNANTPKEVAQNFIFSDEFVQKNTNSEEYVKVLYRTFFGREADEGGLAGWVEVLESGREDRAKVLEGFSGSVEFSVLLKEFGLN